MEESGILSTKRKIPFLTISLVILILDQLTKKWIVNSMWLGQSKSIIGDVVHFTYIRNPNSVFGLHFGGPMISTILTIVAFIFVIYLFIVAERPLFLIAVSFIIGGALGNLTDRLLYREVVDFIRVGVNRFYWPTFNVADSFVTIGIILAIIHWFLESHYADTPSSDSQ
ncbi:signal peptidase II [candidate division WOR-3 bacterium]|nr:signal peptidase II [candidate division WOR-3 bacterium]